MRKNFAKILSLFACFVLVFLISGCNLISCNAEKGKYFVDSKYIIACTTRVKHISLTGEVTYSLDIYHESDIELNYLKYKCELYQGDTLIETFEDEVKISNSNEKYISINYSGEFSNSKVICTGYSDENPDNFARLNAKSEEERENCRHNNIIKARFSSSVAHNTSCYVVTFQAETSYEEFRFCYDTYYHLVANRFKVCPDCGYFEVVNYY